MTIASIDDSSAAAAKAADLRLRGNHEFSAGQLDHAVALYTAALEQCQWHPVTNNHTNTSNTNNTNSSTKPDSIINHEEEMDVTAVTVKEEAILSLCNRSACYSQQEEWELSKRDAQTAWELSQCTAIKAAYRLAKTCLQLKDFNTAKETIQAALRVLDDQELLRNNGVASAPPTPPESSAISPSNNDTATNNTSATAGVLSLQQQRSSLQELWKQLLAASLSNAEQPSATATEHSIKYAKRPISIKEFQASRELGHGNFSEIVTVTHKVTHETFALKKIEKKQAADLHKRQHPNVYNEIQMERRVLLERIANPGHPFIVRMYHAFQDYNSLYYLMDLHVERGDMWSQLRYKNLPGYGETVATNPGESLVMMGCHRSTACLWLYELVSALEYIHSRGIVHRDLKAENILLSATGHVVLIDFGTAKDLVKRDLNGPEFVGTPDFMSPEAVTGTDPPGTSSLGAPAQRPEKSVVVGPASAAGPAADLWALGALSFIMQTGHTPYWSPSPYLAFLKIKRALEFPNLMRPVGIVDDDCWDLITNLMKGDPAQRLGANVYTVSSNGNSMEGQPGGYNDIREHPYFAPVHEELRPLSPTSSSATIKSKSLPIPTLSDWCIRAVAEMAYLDSLDVELCDRHPPGDHSKHDLMRLGLRERAAVMHCLDRRRLLAEPRLYARFCVDAPLARLDKIRPATRDFVGLTQMNDDQGKPPRAQMHDPYANPMETDPISIVHLTSPLFTQEAADADDASRKIWIKLLKKNVAAINRNRPKLVVAVGRIELPARQILARINETIPTVIHDGSSFFAFWKMGVQCIAIQACALGDDSSQLSWIKEQLEQVRMSKHPLFIFVDSDPTKLPIYVLKKLARGRALCIFGVLPLFNAVDKSTSEMFLDSKVKYEANELVNDDVSIRSTDSEEDDEKDSFTTKLRATCENGLYRIQVDEEPDKWTVEFEQIRMPEPKE